MNIPQASRLDKVSTYYFADKLREVARLQAAGRDIINLGIGSPDLPPHPDVIAALHRASLSDAHHGYQSYRGIPELRNAFAQWYERAYSVRLDAEKEILPLIGSKEGIMHISMAFLGAGDQVLVPNPGYPTYSAAAKLAGAEAIHYDLFEENRWFPNLEALAKSDLTKVKIMWINYPHMPSGARPTPELFSSLVAFAKKHGILLCHDNPYNSILNPEPMSIFSVEGSKEVALELNSLSKTFNMAGWRIGMLAGNERIIDTVLKFKSNMDSGMFKPLQLAAVVALQSGIEWTNYLNGIYGERQKVAVDILENLGCEVGKGQSGLFGWGKIPDGLHNAEQLTDHLLNEISVFIVPGSVFGSNGARYVRISLCAPVAVLQSALMRVANAKSLMK